MCFVAAEQPDVPCPERDLLTRWMAFAAEYVSHRAGRRSHRLIPAPVMQDVQPGSGARVGAGGDGDRVVGGPPTRCLGRPPPHQVGGQVLIWDGTDYGDPARAGGLCRDGGPAAEGLMP